MAMREFGSKSVPTLDDWSCKTSTFTVNDVGDPEPVIATIDCREIVIGEDPSVSGWPTIGYKVTGTLAGSTAIEKAPGVTFKFISTVNHPPFKTGDIVGYVETLSGSTTFFKAEQ